MANYVSQTENSVKLHFQCRSLADQRGRSHTFGMTEKRVSPRFKRRRPVFFREWRRHRGLSQEQLAARVGRAISWVSQVERGSIAYTEETLDLLAEALNCTPVDLIVRNPLDAEAPWTIWDQLKPQQQRQAIEVLKAIKRADDEAA